MNEKVTPPMLPADSIADCVRQYFSDRFQGEISETDACWLAELLADLIQSERLISFNAYRLAAEKYLRVLLEIDDAMVKAKNSARQWLTISIALGLPSSANLTEAELARACKISRMAVSIQVSKFLSSIEIPAAYGTGRFPHVKGVKKELHFFGIAR